MYSYFVGFYYNTVGVETKKRFSIDALGAEKALNFAIQFRQDGILKSDNYSERHGK